MWDQVCDILDNHRNIRKIFLTYRQLHLVPESGRKSEHFQSPCPEGDIPTIKLNSIDL